MCSPWLNYWSWVVLFSPRYWFKKTHSQTRGDFPHLILFEFLVKLHDKKYFKKYLNCLQRSAEKHSSFSELRFMSFCGSRLKVSSVGLLLFQRRNKESSINHLKGALKTYYVVCRPTLCIYINKAHSYLNRRDSSFMSRETERLRNEMVFVASRKEGN